MKSFDFSAWNRYIFHPMKRRDFISLLSGTSLFPGLKKPEKKNILFLCIDDMRSVAGCYGGEAITPNLDKLASRGTLFKNHYIQFPVCGPSRHSLLHGVRPETAAMDGHSRMKNYDNHYQMGCYYQHRKEYSTKSLFTLLTAKGMTTRCFGKVAHAGADGKLSIPYQKTGKWECWVDFTPKAKGSYRPAYEIFKGPEKKHSDVQCLKAALKALDRHKNDHFFIAAGFYKPHLPFVAPERIWNLYQKRKISLPKPRERSKEIAEYLYTHKQEFFTYGDQKGRLFSYDYWPDKSMTMDIIRTYYSAVTYTDEHIGKLLARLDKLGLRKKTAVVVWSDHGFHLGDHHHWAKNSPFEVNFRSPLIMELPGIEPKTRKNSDMVETIDIFPTICEYLGIDPPEYLQGKSLLNLIKEKSDDRTAAYSHCMRKNYAAYSMRTKPYRYTEWWNLKEKKKSSAELYDHSADPLETKKLVNNKKFKKKIGDLEPLLARGFDYLARIKKKQ
jgi:arylsulfatase A-like enzyme